MRSSTASSGGPSASVRKRSPGFTSFCSLSMVRNDLEPAVVGIGIGPEPLVAGDLDRQVRRRRLVLRAEAGGSTESRSRQGSAPGRASRRPRARCCARCARASGSRRGGSGSSQSRAGRERRALITTQSSSSQLLWKPAAKRPTSVTCSCMPVPARIGTPMFFSGSAWPKLSPSASSPSDWLVPSKARAHWPHRGPGPAAFSDGAVAAAGPVTCLIGCAACGACAAAAGVRPAAARAIAHAISFILTPVTWVGDWSTATGPPRIGRPYRRAVSSSLKRLMPRC